MSSSDLQNQVQNQDLSDQRIQTIHFVQKQQNYTNQNSNNSYLVYRNPEQNRDGLFY